MTTLVAEAITNSRNEEAVMEAMPLRNWTALPAPAYQHPLLQSRRYPATRSTSRATTGVSVRPEALGETRNRPHAFGGPVRAYFSRLGRCTRVTIRFDESGEYGDHWLPTDLP